jgi:hypothetical protein
MSQHMTIRHLVLIGAAVLLLSTLPGRAGPCTKDIEATQAKIEARLNALAAAGPSAEQSVGAQLHRQPTPGSIANAERKLGDLSPETIVKVNAAMDRAQKADNAGDERGCRQALAEVAHLIEP